MTAEHHQSGRTRNDSDGNNPPPPPDVKFDAAAPNSKVVTLEDLIAVLRTTHTPKTDFLYPAVITFNALGNLMNLPTANEQSADLKLLLDSFKTIRFE